jgi:uncharacterized membrane protein
MAALLALLSATAYGAGDFFGGLSARRLPSVAVVLRSHVVGLLGLLALVPLVGGALTGNDLRVSALGGVAGGLGVMLFYRAMTTGAMSLVAPVTSVTAALVPVSYGLATGDRPSWLGLVGIPLALGAVVMLAREPAVEGSRGMTLSQLGVALAAGAGFGAFFIALDTTSADAGLWPVVAGRVASITLFSLVTLVNPAVRVGDGRARSGSALAMIVACGLLDAWANALFLAATRHGMISLVSVLSALYPAATLLLARSVLGERLARPQLAGVVLAVVAVALVTVA